MADINGRNVRLSNANGVGKVSGENIVLRAAKRSFVMMESFFDERFGD